MPNWIKNQITIIKQGGIVLDLLDAIKGPNGVVDFGALIPMPPSLDVETKDLNAEHVAIYGRTPDGHTLNAWQEGLVAIYRGNLDLYGYTTGGTWAQDHWGCKWNASCVSIEDISNQTSIKFSTPWNPPIAWLRCLGARFPDLRAVACYSSEDAGYEAGAVKIAGGRIEVRKADDRSPDAYALFGALFGADHIDIVANCET